MGQAIAIFPEVMVLLANLGDRPFAIARGERIGAGGFGSTGSKAKASKTPRRPKRG